MQALKCLVDGNDQMRMARLVQAHRKVMVTKITSLYNGGEPKSISEHTIMCKRLKHPIFLSTNLVIDFNFMTSTLSSQYKKTF